MNTYILYNTKQYNTTNDDEKISSFYNLLSIDESIFKRLLYNDLHKKFYFETSYIKIQEKFDIRVEKSNDKIKIIAMPELNKDQLNSYLQIFNDEPDNLDKYAEYLAIISYNQVSPNKYQVKKHLEKLLEEQSSYWEDDNNCSITLNEIFIKRQFNYNIVKKNIDTTKIINPTNTTILNKMINIKKEDLNYLNNIKHYADSNDIHKSSANYYPSKHSNILISDVIEIYKRIPTEYLKYNFLCNMLCTRTHCHLILNNIEILKMSKPIMDKYKGVFKYLFGYAWLTLRQEESFKKSKTSIKDRFVFDADTANNLPVFPFAHDDINQNPYACILLDNKLMNLKENCMSMKMIKNNYEKYYGVCDSNTFKKRINIFTNGSNQSRILNKIDWNHFAITGSAMTACGMKYNPLFDLYKQNINSELTDHEFATYLFHYYNKSDIDLVCNYKSIYDFLDGVNKFINDLIDEYNIKKIINENVHTASIIMSDDFINNELEELGQYINNNVISLEYVKKNYDNINIKTYFYNKFYIPWKNEQNEKILIKNSNKLNQYVYKEYLSAIPSHEFRLYNFDYEIIEDIDQDYEKYIYGSTIKIGLVDPNKIICKLSESIRFQIKSNQINRSWEIFKTHDTNFFSTISKFHMGFVRALWNGQTALCLPSYISAMMLQLSTDYKYFASIRNPIEIINKYRSRGYGIILNHDEKIHMAYYNSIKSDNEEENKWCDMYNINTKNKSSISNIFGPKSFNDVIFKPSKFFEGIQDDCFKNIDHIVYETAEEAFTHLYLINDSKSIYKCKCINDKGFITPLSRSIIKIGYQLYT